jgi:hypothetical protein
MNRSSSLPAIMEGLTNAGLSDSSCNFLRLTGKPAGLFSFARLLFIYTSL